MGNTFDNPPQIQKDSGDKEPNNSFKLDVLNEGPESIHNKLVKEDSLFDLNI